MKRILTVLGIAMFTMTPVVQAKPLRVVATLSTFADLAQTVGGEHVKVSYIASPKFNPHFIEPRPSDVLKVKKAGLFIHAGLDLEMWRWPLVDAAGNGAVRPGGERELDLSRGISLIEIPTSAVSRSQGDIHIYGNPHYWVAPANAGIMAQTIADKLTEIDPANEADYQAAASAFVQKLNAAIVRWRQEIAPLQGKEAVAYHNEWPYLTNFAGLRVDYFLEPKPGIPPTPKHVQFLENYMRQKGIHVILQSNSSPNAASRKLAEATGARLVTLCHNVGGLPGCDDYFAMMDYNLNQLTEVFEN
ncbi:MAG: zinc ABC transporter substrate-binding protein [Candidatus Omnitrophica bacterium]|nr:zinc ABC transporter substrate-binding protein [Candidatus Omnitrophota bacterium]